MQLNEEKLKESLDKQSYNVLRQQGTEAPFSGELLHEKRSGEFTCKVCGSVIFNSNAKFDSGTGWPSFTEAVDANKIKLTSDNTLGMQRTAIDCANCGSHLGHLFNDGPKERGGMRYCVNSVCFNFEPKQDD